MATGAGRRGWAWAAIVLAFLAAVAALLPPRGTPGIEVADLGEVRALLLHFAGYAALALCADPDLAKVKNIIEFQSPGGNTLTSIFLNPIPIQKDNLNIVVDAGWITKETLCAGVSGVAVCE